MELSKGTGTHKWKVKVNGKTIQFGAKNYLDFTLGATEAQKKSYLARHSKTEDWTQSGINTAGFWSRWLLWNRKSISASLADIKKRFKI